MDGETRTEDVNIARLTSDGAVQVTEYPVGTGFNTYTLVGEQDRLTLYINGVEVAVTESIHTGVARDFIWLGSATGADRTARFDVDYLRVYAGGAVHPETPDS